MGEEKRREELYKGRRASRERERDVRGKEKLEEKGGRGAS